MRLPACCRHGGPAEHSWKILLAGTLAAGGCGPPSAEKALEQAFRDNPKAQRVQLVKFEGTVTVDGQPPNKPNTTLFIILNDPQHPQDPSQRPKLVGGVDDQGNFSFSTYGVHDGVEAGSYVVTFVQLHHPKGIFGHRTSSLFEQPDELKNLYSDPEKNANDPQFKVDLQPPGRNDWHFNLDVAGKDPVTTPGPHAITRLDYR
jgi:hypothetical protein